MRGPLEHGRVLPTLGGLGQFMLHQLHETSEEVLCRARGWGDQLPGQPMSLLNIFLAVHMAAPPLPLTSYIPPSSRGWEKQWRCLSLR